MPLVIGPPPPPPALPVVISPYSGYAERMKPRFDQLEQHTKRLTSYGALAVDDARTWRHELATAGIGSLTSQDRFLQSLAAWLHRATPSRFNPLRRNETVISVPGTQTYNKLGAMAERFFREEKLAEAQSVKDVFADASKALSGQGVAELLALYDHVLASRSAAQTDAAWKHAITLATRFVSTKEWYPGAAAVLFDRLLRAPESDEANLSALTAPHGAYGRDEDAMLAAADEAGRVLSMTGPTLRKSALLALIRNASATRSGQAVHIAKWVFDTLELGHDERRDVILEAAPQAIGHWAFARAFIEPAWGAHSPLFGVQLLEAMAKLPRPDEMTLFAVMKHVQAHALLDSGNNLRYQNAMRALHPAFRKAARWYGGAEAWIRLLNDDHKNTLSFSSINDVYALEGRLAPAEGTKAGAVEALKRYQAPILEAIAEESFEVAAAVVDKLVFAKAGVTQSYAYASGEYPLLNEDVLHLLERTVTANDKERASEALRSLASKVYGKQRDVFEACQKRILDRLEKPAPSIAMPR